jgi:uncharacterized repeat protein (TIGR02543 family)
VGISFGLDSEYASPAVRQTIQGRIDGKFGEYDALASTVHTAYDKARIVHDKIVAERDYSMMYIEGGAVIGNTLYQSTGYYYDPYPYAHNILGVLDTTTNGPVCEAYAEAYTYILNRLGVETISVVGTATTGGSGGNGGHEWNLVKLDDGYYYCDVTWDDGDRTDKDVGNEYNRVRYKYFMVGSGNDLFGDSHAPAAAGVVGGTYALPLNINAGDYDLSAGAYLYITAAGFNGDGADCAFAFGDKASTSDPRFYNALGYGAATIIEFDVPTGLEPRIPLYKWRYNPAGQYLNTKFTNPTALSQGEDYAVTVENVGAGRGRVWLTGKGAYRGVTFVMVDFVDVLIAFNANGGAYADSGLVRTYSPAETANGILPEMPLRSGYVFAGWNTAADGSGAGYDGVLDMDNTTYYAVWSPVTKDSITLEALPLYSEEGFLARGVAVYAGASADCVLFLFAQYDGQKMLSVKVFKAEVDENGYASAVVAVALDEMSGQEKILALDAETFAPLSATLSPQ